MRGRLALVILALSIGGCAPWPESLPLNEELATAAASPEIDSQRLREQSQRLELELDMLVLGGATGCLPAHVVGAEQMATRLHNELRVGLYRDVVSDLTVFSRKIDELRRRLEYLGEHTRCREPHAEVAAQPAEIADKRVAEIKDWGKSLRYEAAHAVAVE